MAENRRVKMTKGMIKGAYIDFIADFPDRKPSVTEVCDRADVNRSTFYTHYKDIDALCEDIEQDVLEILPVLIPEDDPDYIAKNRTLLTDFFTKVSNDKRLLVALLSIRQDKEWEFKIASVIYQNFRPEGVVREGSVFYYEYIFCVTGSFGILREWFRGGFPMRPDLFGALMFELSRKSMTNSPDLSELE